MECDKGVNNTTYLVKEKISNTFIAVIDRKFLMVPYRNISHQRLTIYGVSGVSIVKIFTNE